MTNLCAGIDAGKEFFDVHVAGAGRRFENSRSGCRAVVSG